MNEETEKALELMLAEFLDYYGDDRVIAVNGAIYRMLEEAVKIGRDEGKN